MNGQINRLEQLEARFERLRIQFLQVQGQLAIALQQIAQMQSGGVGGFPGNTTTVYSIPAVVISASSSLPGQTVSALQGGTLVALPGTYTVYNQMTAATVATTGKNIMVGANGDGSFSVITQSC